MKHTELIVAIESLLMDPTHQMDRLEPLAQAYAEACKNLNSSLIKCINVLREGNTVEAIRLAHAAHVLDDYDTLVLDFNSRDLWLEAVKTFTDVRIPKISEEMAEELDTCEKKVEDQKDILKRHRLLAYSNGPMFKRIQVLRRLIARNPKFFEWQKDLESYVQCYYDQLSKEIPKIVKISGIKQIEDEINSVAQITNEIPSLSAAPPTPLVMAIQARKEKLIREDIQKRRDIILGDMQKLTTVLKTSYEQKQFKEAEDAYNFWNACVEKLRKLNLTPPQDIQKEAAQAIQWVRNEKAHMIAENEFYKQQMLFERSVNSENVPLITVQKNYEKLENAAIKAGIPIPSDLQEALEDREYEWRRRQNRKKTLNFMIIVLAVAALGASGYFGSKMLYQNKVVSDIEKELKELLETAKESYNFTEAVEKANEIRNNNKEIAQHKNIAKLIEDIEDSARKNEDERTDFNKKAKVLEEQIVDNKSTDPELELQLKKLGKLALTGSEQDRYRILAKEYNKNKEKKTSELNRAFVDKADSLLQKIKNLNSTSDDLLDVIQDFRSQVNELEKWPDPVTDSLKKQKIAGLYDTLDKKKDEFQTHQKSVDLQKKYTKAFDSLAKDSRDVQSYARNLEKYLSFVKENSVKDANSKPDEIEARLTEKEIWNRIDEWNKFMNEYGSVMNSTPITLDSAKSFLEAWNKTGKSLLVDKDQPANVLLLEKIDTLQKLGETMTDSSLTGIVEELVKTCNQMSVVTYWTARKPKTQNWYYFLETDKDTYKPPYVSEWGDVRGENMPSEPIYSKDLKLSPHVDLCKAIVKLTKKLPEDFEENAVLILSTILEATQKEDTKTTSKLDPLFAWMVLTIYTEKLGDCNQDFKKAFEPMLKICNQYDKLTISKINLLRPNDVTRGQRDMAIRVLEVIQEEQLFEKCKENFSSNNKVSSGQCAGIYRMAGFVAYEDGHITIYPVLRNSSASGTLWVCVENSKLDTEIEFLEVGKLKKGTISPDFSKIDPNNFLFAPVFVFEYVK